MRDSSGVFARRLMAVAIGQALALGSAGAATITVGGGCSLPQAIEAANSDSAVGGCTPGSGADRIVLGGGNYVIGSGSSGNAFVPVGTAITIDGGGATLSTSFSGDPPDTFRFFTVLASGDLTLDDLTLTGGRAEGEGANGGAVLVEGGTLTVTDSTLSGHYAAGNGGAIYNDGGSVSISGSTLSGNYAYYSGGAINSTGGLVVTNTTVSGNTAVKYGGGIEAYAGTLALSDCTITGNTSDWGGGFETYTAATVERCSITGNYSTGDAGGISVWGDGNLSLSRSEVSGNTATVRGGGMAIADTAIVTMTNSTVSGNTADRAAGIDNGGTLTLNSVTLSNNVALGGGSDGPPDGPPEERPAGGKRTQSSRVAIAAAPPNVTGGLNAGGTETLVNSIIAGNTGYDCDGTVESLSHTLIEDATCGATLFGDPGLEPLTDNGGPTRTHALSAGSPAIDAGDPAACGAFATDQRGSGYPRSQGAACDLGGFEASAAPPAGIPTLASGALALLSMLMGVLGLGAARRRR